MRSTQVDDDWNEIRAEVERERRASRHRDRVSGERVHPVQHDVNCLVNFVVERRSRQPGAFDLLRRIGARVDTAALRAVVTMIRDKGSCDKAMQRCCDRVEKRCDTIEVAIQLATLLGLLNHHQLALLQPYRKDYL